MRRSLWIGGLAACIATAGACDAVGGALVGDKPVPAKPPPSLKIGTCPAPPSCAEPVPRPALIAPPLDAFDLTACGPGAPLHGWQALLDQAAAVSCVELDAQLEAQDGAALELDHALLNLVNLMLRAEQPVTVRLREPELRQTSIELRGPIRLEISRARALEELRIRGQASAAGAPSLYVTERATRGLVAGSPELPFEGAVELAFVAARDSQVVAETTVVRSGTFYDGRIEAQRLEVVESELDHVTLRVDEGRIAASIVTLVEVTACGSLGLFATASTGSLFAACSDGPLRVYQSNVTDGLLDGSIDTDVTDLCNVRLGQRSPTTLRLWSGTLFGSSLCEHTTGVVVGGQAERNGCEGRALQPGVVCAVQEGQHLDDNVCEPMRTAPMCEVLPPHERPEQDRQDAEGRLRSRE